MLNSCTNLYVYCENRKVSPIQILIIILDTLIAWMNYLKFYSNNGPVQLPNQKSMIQFSQLMVTLMNDKQFSIGLRHQGNHQKLDLTSLQLL